MPRVTAIVVARSGGEHLTRTLDALGAQTRAPDAVVGVFCGTDADADAADVFGTGRASAGDDADEGRRSIDGLVAAGRRSSFGQALAAAVALAPPPASEDEWLWLLAQDTAPDPGALQALLAAAETSPSVAVAGPKLVHWDDGDRLREFGTSMTRFGATVPLVDDELDQAQHDRLSDVLGVSPAGMLVRHAVWRRLGGFDPALAVVDDGLDFCVRARLAGHRVVLVPAARVATAGDGVVGLPRARRASGQRKAWRARRSAQLHRRMVYSPALALPLHWLSLLPLAVLRCLWRLVRKEPGGIPGELLAALGALVAWGRVHRSRRALARSRRVGWSAIAPLRMPQPEVRRARALRREANAPPRAARHPLAFFSGGGAWTVLALAIVGIVLFAPLLGATTVTGGGLLPLGGIGDVWRGALYGWRDAAGAVGPADPFGLVLALLGTLTFWQPSFALVLLVLAALPLAGLGAWFCAARLTPRAGLRAFAAIAWALAPPLLAALQVGRPAAVLAHLLLPWLAFAAFSARRSWAAAAATGLLAALVLACAPSLGPALGLAWLVLLAVSPRRIARLAWTAVPTLALFAPLAWQQAARGTPLAVFADPGVAVAFPQPAGWQLLLGHPDGLSRWQGVADALGAGPAAGAIIAVLVAPLVVLALLALLARRPLPSVSALGVALLGLATALLASHWHLASSGSESVAVWPGTGLSLYWLGLVASATIGLTGMRAASAPAWVAGLALAVAVAPLAIALPLGTSALRVGGERLPALVVAEAAHNPRVGTLVLAPQGDGGIRVQLVRGPALTLDEQSTLEATRRGVNAADARLARLAANLASQSGYDSRAELTALGIGFVVLDDAAGDEARQAWLRASSALDANPALLPVGATGAGGLWSFAPGAASASEVAAVPADQGGAVRAGVLAGQGVLLGVTLLLAIPTGRVDERAGVRRRRGRTDAGDGSRQDRAASAEVRPAEAPGDEAAGAEARTVEEARPAEARPAEAGAAEGDEDVTEDAHAG